MYPFLRRQNLIAPSTKGGALVSLREPPRLLTADEPEPQRMLAICASIPRTVYTKTKQRDTSEHKRVKAVLKQVVGSPFTGMADTDIKEEREIIRELVKASQLKTLGNASLSRAAQNRVVDRILDHLLGRFKALFKDRLNTYLNDLTWRLSHRKTRIRWNARNNNCQSFCDALINKWLFGSLIDRDLGLEDANKRKSPLYLMSFVCRQTAYAKASVRTKFDVPNGLTEEYLLRFRYGLHEDSDIVDSLQEYWHDWGAFGTHLYPFQDLFPWDCSEAFNKHSVTCSNCSISKHVWAFPYDSWSIISLHLGRDRFLYGAQGPENTSVMTNEEWLRNRLTLLNASDALTASAVAMAGNNGFRKATAWMNHDSNARYDRLKLGGIHRAQPWSRFFQRGAYNHFFITEWAHLRYADKVAAYETLRNLRMEMLDVGVTHARAAEKRSTYVGGGSLCGGGVAGPSDLQGATCGSACGIGICTSCGTSGDMGSGGTSWTACGGEGLGGGCSGGASLGACGGGGGVGC